VRHLVPLIVPSTVLIALFCQSVARRPVCKCLEEWAIVQAMLVDAHRLDPEDDANAGLASGNAVGQSDAYYGAQIGYP